MRITPHLDSGIDSAKGLQASSSPGAHCRVQQEVGQGDGRVPGAVAVDHLVIFPRNRRVSHHFSPNARLQRSKLAGWRADQRPLRDTWDALCLKERGYRLTRADIAARCRHRAVNVIGCGEHVHSKSPTYAADMLATPIGPASRKAFAMAGLKPSDMHMAQIYDCYTITVLLTLAPGESRLEWTGYDEASDAWPDPDQPQLWQATIQTSDNAIAIEAAWYGPGAAPSTVLSFVVPEREKREITVNGTTPPVRSAQVLGLQRKVVDWQV